MTHWIKVPAFFEVVNVRRMDDIGAQQQRVRVEIEYQGKTNDDRDFPPGFWFYAPLGPNQPLVGDVYELAPRPKTGAVNKVLDMVDSEARRMSTAAEDPRVAYEED